MAKKVLSIALALLMIVNVFAVAVSATQWTTENAVITLKTDNAKPQPGDEVTVTVALQNNYNVHGLQIMLAYDKDYYEVVGTTTEEVFTNLLVSDGSKFTGVAQALLGEEEQDAMYAGLYSAEQKAQYGLIRIGYVWLASLGSAQGNTATPVFENATDLASFKLKVKDTASADGKGVIMVDPIFVVETGVDVPAFDTRSATYVGKGAATISASATSGKLYGLPINVDGAKFAGCTHASVEAVAAKEATHTEDGNIAYWYCADCETYFSDEALSAEIALADTVVEASGHGDLTDVEWSSDADNHWKVCSCGAELEKATHEFEWVVDEDSTCDTEGVQHEECTTCGAKKNEGTAVDKKQHNIQYIAAKDATCTDAGNIEHYFCDGCNKYYVDSEGETEISEEDIMIDALGHDTTKTDAKAPTCTDEGNIDYWYCEVCDTYFSDEAYENEIKLEDTVIDAEGHDEGAWVVTKEATLEEAGLKELKCTKCGFVLDSEVIPSLGEDPANYDELKALVEQAEALDRDAYEAEGIEAIDAILAEIDYSLKITQQDKVDAWADELEAALAALKYDVSGAEATVTTVLSKKTVATDDIITVTVKLTTNYPVTNIQLPVIYDKTKFSLVDFTSGSSYLTFEDSSFTAGSYEFAGNAGLETGFKYTANEEKWNTEEAKAQYDYAWITATFNSKVNSSNQNLAIPNDETFVTFQLKALADVEDATQSVFISPDWAKTADVKKGQLVIGFSATEVNNNPLSWVTSGMTYNLETIAVEGVNFTGTVESDPSNAANTEEELTTIELISDGEVKYSTTVAGTGVQGYSISGVEAGTYTVKISKADHATLEFEETIEGDLELTLKIHLLGDIDGNGKLTIADYSKVLKHVNKTALLEGYEVVCADADANGKVTISDYSKILKHVNKTNLMW